MLEDDIFELSGLKTGVEMSDGSSLGEKVIFLIKKVNVETAVIVRDASGGGEWWWARKIGGVLETEQEVTGSPDKLDGGDACPLGDGLEDDTERDWDAEAARDDLIDEGVLDVIVIISVAQKSEVMNKKVHKFATLLLHGHWRRRIVFGRGRISREKFTGERRELRINLVKLDARVEPLGNEGHAFPVGEWKNAGMALISPKGEDAAFADAVDQAVGIIPFREIVLLICKKL